MHSQPNRSLNVLMLTWATLLIVAGGCAAPGSRRSSSLPGIEMDQRSGELQIEGEVCIDQGVLEYLAVATRGKMYESVFALSCRPSHLQAAMLMGGYVTGEVQPESRGDFSPGTDSAASNAPQGAPQTLQPSDEYWETASSSPTHVTIDVDVQQDDGSWKRFPVERFLRDRATGRQPARLTWAFTGSFFVLHQMTQREHFAADVDKSLIALFYDPTALLNLSGNIGNPYRGKGLGLEIDQQHVPKKGTSVRVILHPDN